MPGIDMQLHHGILAVDKPEGISSAAVVARVKKALGVKKVGHTGTLDPFATGLMLCGINKGTKISRFLLDSAKRYVAGVTLGKETDTLDITGTVVREASQDQIDAVTPQKFTALLEKFKGMQMQQPPVYSALKHKGKPLYQLAREGRPVQKPPRQIEIHSIEIIALNLPHVTLNVHCSSGTYIRSLAHDMGRALGCGAMLSSLRRTETCGVPVDRAVSLNELEAMDRETAFDRYVTPMAQSLSFLPAIHADAELMTTVRFGRPFYPSRAPLKSRALESRDSIFPDFTSHTADLLSEQMGQGHGAGQERLDGDDHEGAKNRGKRVDSPQENSLVTSQFFRVIDPNGDLAAVVAYDPLTAKYDYCCVLVN